MDSYIGKVVNSMNSLSTIDTLVGTEGIKAAYERTLRSKKLDIVCLSTNYEQVIGSYFEREYSPRLYEKGRVTRELLPDTTGNRADAKQKTVGHEVKFIKTGETSESDMIIADDTVTFISFNQSSPCAIVVADAQIVGSIRMQF